MSMNQYQEALEKTSDEHVKAIADLDKAMQHFWNTAGRFHDAEKRVLAEMVCKWCHANPCSCPLSGGQTEEK